MPHQKQLLKAVIGKSVFKFVFCGTYPTSLFFYILLISHFEVVSSKISLSNVDFPPPFGPIIAKKIIILL